MLDKSRVDVVIPDVAVHQYVLDCMKNYGDAVAFIDNTAKIRLTYSQIIEGAKLLATSLYRHGVRKGDIVGIISETTAYYGLASLGIMACGAIVSPCNPVYTKEEMTHQYSHSGAKFMLCSKTCLPVFKQIVKDLPDLKKVFTIQPCPGYQCLEDLLRSGSIQEYPPPVSFDPANDAALLPYSSGTTGLSKGVVLTHKNLIAILLLFNSGIILRNDIGYGVVPSFHIYGFAMQLNNMVLGSCFITDARFDFKTMLEVIQREKVTYLLLVPPLMVLIAKSLEVDKYDVSSVRKIFSGAAPMAPSLAHAVTKKMKNSQVVQGWGLTECCPGTLASFLSTPVTSIGSVCLNTEIRVMKEYFKNPVATRKAIDKDGWFYTGDIGHVDKHGFYYIVDRLKELIKFKGFQVAPAELEALLLNHPQIDDVAVIGVPNLEAGELPKAFVVRKTTNLSERDVQDFVKGGVTFIGVIPKSASGKILRRHLRNLPSGSKAKL